MALEEAGGTALLSGTAESATTVGRGRLCGPPVVWGGGGQSARGCHVGSYLLMVSSSSESPRLVLSSSLVMRVEELSYPARWRSSLEGPLGLWPPTEQEHRTLRHQVTLPPPGAHPCPASSRAWPSSPPCSLLSLLRGLSRLSDTTDSVSVSGSRFSWLLDTLGLEGWRPHARHNRAPWPCLILAQGSPLLPFPALKNPENSLEGWRPGVPDTTGPFWWQGR